MLALTAVGLERDDPLRAVVVGERPEPVARPNWTIVTLRAASLNHHDLWALRGVGLDAGQLPRILGCDGAGVDADGNEVVIHSAISDPTWAGPEEFDPRLSLVSEKCDGTFATKIAVPTRNVVSKPANITFEHAACLPTAWLTAYRMLFTHAQAGPGSRVLVQGAGGGVATALIILGRAAGVTVWVTSRTEAKRRQALALGADAAFETGQRLPERVDAVLDTVGAATWRHSLNAVRPGGTVVLAGMTSGEDTPAYLSRIFLSRLRIIGTTIGTRDELVKLLTMCSELGLRPPIHATMPLESGIAGMRAMLDGDLFGKIVYTM